MCIALQSVLGSSSLNEASDFCSGLFLTEGTFATMGFQVTMEAPPFIWSILKSSPNKT
jgi:N-methylhydantoinase B